MKIVLLLLFLLLCCSVSAQTIDSRRSFVTFSVKNMGMGHAEGKFNSIYGHVLLDPHHLNEAEIEAVVDISSLGTGIDMRDRHLHDADFFDLEKYPVATFVCEQVEEQDIGYIATGVLEIKGHSKVVQIPFTLLDHKQEQLLEGSLTLDRNDFSLGEGMSNLIVGDEVRVFIKCYVLK